jgi:hypothetical protein
MMRESVSRLDAAFLRKARRALEHHFSTTRTGNELNARWPGAIAMHGVALYRDRRYASPSTASRSSRTTIWPTHP